MCYRFSSKYVNYGVAEMSKNSVHPYFDMQVVLEF